MTGLDELSAAALARNPALEAIEFDRRWHHWGELASVANAVRTVLGSAGLGSDAPVAFVPRNRPESIAALLGLIAERRTIRMIYAFQSPTALAAAIERARPAAVVAHREDVSPEMLATLQRDGIVAVALDAGNAAAIAGHDRAGVAGDRRGPDDARIEILTSGTTGPPKQFPIPYRLLEQHFLATPLTARQGTDPETLPPFLLYFPLGNITGLYSTLPTLMRGQKAVLLERFSVEAWHDYVLRYRPAHTGLPPSCFQLVLDAGIPPEDLASIRHLGTGAAPLDPVVQQAFEERYGIPILLSYGATEFAGPVTAMTPELHAIWGRSKLGSVGRAMPGAQLRVVDPASGTILPPGSEGLLEVISPRIGPGWIRTADIAIIDEDGFLFHRGRADGAIMRGGFKILPEAVERVLLLHPAISDVSVVGIPDRRLGEVPAAAIRLRPGESAPAVTLLEAHVRQHLLATHVPVRWMFCDDLPRTPSLKHDRAAIRRLLVKAR